ncbi:hypothetical protein K7432_014598, partial [Basidiobolus ranarum]
MSSVNTILPTRVIALFPYESNVAGDLTFEKEEIIEVVGRENENWWKGRIDHRVGVFPKNFVEPLEEESLPPPPPLPPRRPEENASESRPGLREELSKPDLWRSNTLNVQARGRDLESAGRNLLRSNTVSANQSSTQGLEKTIKPNEITAKYGGQIIGKSFEGLSKSNHDNIRRIHEESGNPLLKKNITINEK